MKRRDFLKLAMGTGTGLALSASPFALLFSKDKKEQAEAWKEIAENWKFTTCNLCPAGCGVVCRVVNGKAVRVQGNPVHPVNRGRLCPKGLSSLQFLYHPERLKTPLKKDGSGFTPVSWKEALDSVSEKLSAIKGTPQSLLFLKKENYSLTDRVMERFMASFGSPNLVCVDAPSYMETAVQLMQGWKGKLAYDFENTNYILSFGTSLFEGFSSPVYAMRCYGYLRQERPGKKAKLVQVEPRFSNAAGRSDEFIAIKPGTEGIFALGIAYVIVKEGLYDDAFIQKYASGFEDFRDEEGNLQTGFKNFVLKEYPVDFVSQVTGAPVDTMMRVAREFALNKPSIAIADTGSNNASNAAWNAVCVHALNALVGSLDVPGGILFQEEPPYQSFVETQNDGEHKPRIDRVADGFSFAESAPGEIAENVLKENPYKIQAAFLYNVNTVFSEPQGEKWKQALSHIPFKVSFSSFLDETSSLCDLIIPDVSFFEKWDAVSAPSSGYPVVGLMQPVVNTKHQSIATADFLLNLSVKLGSAFAFSNFKEAVNQSLKGLYEAKRGTVFGPDFEVDFIKMSEQRGFWFQAQKDYDEFFEKVTNSGGWFDPHYAYRRFGSVLNTPSGKFEFYLRPLHEKVNALSREKGLPAEKALAQMNIESDGSYAYLPHFEKPIFHGEEKEFPFVLLLYPSLALTSSLDANLPYLQEIHGGFVNNQWDSFVELHPETAKKLGIQDGEKVRLTSPQWNFIVTAKIFKGIPEEALGMALGQGHTQLAPFASGIGVNPLALVLTSADKISGASPLITTRVKITKA